VADGDVAVAADVPQPAITAHITAAAIIHRLLLFDSNRRTLGRRSCWAVATAADETVWWGLVGSYSFMVAFLLLRQPSRDWQQFMWGSYGLPVRGLGLLQGCPVRPGAIGVAA
jgi:hypothetical protein